MNDQNLDYLSIEITLLILSLYEDSLIVDNLKVNTRQFGGYY